MAARAPWGFVPPAGQYPPHQGPYPPPEDHRSRPAFPQPEVGGFYNPVLSAAVQQSPYPHHPHPQPYGHPGHHGHISHSQSYHPPAHYHQSAPTNSTSHIPNVLKPGVPSRTSTGPASRSNSSDLFFQQSPPALPPLPAFPQAQSQPQHTYSTQHHSEHPSLRHAHTSPAGPPLPQKPYFAPPIPPKPSISSPPTSGASPTSLYPQQIAASSSMQPQSYAGPSSQPLYNDMKEQQQPIQSSPTLIDEEAEFKRILALSAQESEERDQYRKQTMSKEDQELERALQESLRLTSYQDFSFPVSSSPQGPAFPFPEVGPSFDQTTSSSSETDSSFSPRFPFPQQLTPTHTFEPEPPRDNAQTGRYTSSPTGFVDQIAADEAFARRLFEEQQERPVVSSPQPLPQPQSQSQPPRPPSQPQSQPQSQTHSPHPVPVPFSSPINEPAPPLYNEVIRNALPQSAPGPSSLPNSLFPPQSSISPPTSSPSPSHSRPSSPKPNISRHSSANAVPTPSPVSEHRFEKSKSMVASMPRPSLPAKRESSGSNSLALPTLNGQALKTSPSSSNLNVPHDGGNRRMSVTSHNSEPPMNANQYVDTELLRGVSLGFGVPSISAQLTPMQGPIPNVIALPYGKCPPFHVKAPSWKDLLKLMARLSGTRLEPTIEAMAVVKTDMKVRIVVNFVKVHQASADWHVTLYMTIDYPIPANHPYAYKYKNGDPNMLPYSYSLSPIPAFLRDGADAPMSKWYNIPTTQANPFRKLPISFPDLAGYLLSVLSESRGAVHDSSSGLRRLGKLIDSCYPTENTGKDEEEPERRGLFDRLIRRNHRQSRDRNAETFDVITPFFADEHGA